MTLNGISNGVLDAGKGMRHWTTDSFPPNGSNYSLYSNPKVDELVDKAAAPIDEAKQQKSPGPSQGPEVTSPDHLCGLTGPTLKVHGPAVRPGAGPLQFGRTFVESLRRRPALGAGGRTLRRHGVGFLPVRRSGSPQSCCTGRGGGGGPGALSYPSGGP